MQHHLAHVAACLAENEIAPPVLGVAWDGTGYGGDGTIWGGEFLHVEKTGWRRVACLRQFPLPGGEAAVREPRRSALGLLVAAFGSEAFGMNDLPPVAAFDTAERRIVSQMLARDVNAPLTSSVGRLLDAFAALCGLRQVSAYEGQAPIEFDSAAGDLATGRCYDFPISADKDGLLIVDWQPALESLLADLRAGASSGSISEAVHNGLVEVVAAVAALPVRRAILDGEALSLGADGRALTEATWTSRASGDSPAGFEAYQNLQLITRCDGALMVLGTHKTLLGDDWADLWRVELDPDTLAPTFTKVAKRNLTCRSASTGDTRYCDFQAGAGGFIGAGGRLYIYGVEHYDDAFPGDGEGVKVREFPPT